MLNEVKHLAIAREILRCAQNDIVHHFTCSAAIVAVLMRGNPSVIETTGSTIGVRLSIRFNSWCRKGPD
jgi:hypothetical protein